MTRTQNFLKSAINKIDSSDLEILKNKSTRQIDETKYNIESSLSAYLQASYNRFKKIRTLLYKTQPVSLKDHYVCCDLLEKQEDKTIPGESLLKELTHFKRIIISGTAGSGKSILLRKLFVDIYEKQHEFIPILIELRIPSVEEKSSIIDFVSDEINGLSNSASRDVIECLIEKGLVIFILDGFDEIEHSKVDMYEKEILKLSRKNPNAPIIVSSRPDEKFSSWSEFHTLFTKPLTKSQSVELISKIKYESVVKRKFIKELESHLYDRHEDFLSNPLLLTMMLITYQQLAYIPEKIHIFYEEAFTALYSKHDATKELYRRESFCNLASDDFKRLLSTFCFITYSERKFRFSEKEAIEYIKICKDIEDYKSLNERNFFQDLVKNICILQKDGSEYQFSHRSFQEYFCAKYLCENSIPDDIEFIKDLFSYTRQDSVIDLALAINREKTERYILLPAITQIRKDLDALKDNDLVEFLDYFYAGIHARKVRYKDSDDWTTRVGFAFHFDKFQGFFIFFLEDYYRDKLPEVLSIIQELDKLGSVKFHQDYEKIKNILPDNDRENIVPLSRIKESDLAGTSFFEYREKVTEFFNVLEAEITKTHQTKKKSIKDILINARAARNEQGL